MDKKERVLAVVSYLWILLIIPIAWKNKSRQLLSHVYSGIVLFFLWSLIIFIFKIPFAGVLIGVLLMLACLVFTIWGIYDAVTGRDSKIPGVEKIVAVLI